MAMALVDVASELRHLLLIILNLAVRLQTERGGQRAITHFLMPTTQVLYRR